MHKDLVVQIAIDRGAVFHVRHGNGWAVVDFFWGEGADHFYADNWITAMARCTDAIQKNPDWADHLKLASAANEPAGLR